VKGVNLLFRYFQVFLENTSLKVKIKIMNTIKKIALAFFLSVSFVAVAPMVIAEEAVVSSDKVVADTIGHIEKGLAEVKKSDFSAANLHLKSARAASEEIQGHEELVKKGLEGIIQGQIQVKFGDVDKASAELNKALGFYKSIK
jgi:hypothetical protein